MRHLCSYTGMHCVHWRARVVQHIETLEGRLGVEVPAPVGAGELVS